MLLCITNMKVIIHNQVETIRAMNEQLQILLRTRISRENPAWASTNSNFSAFANVVIQSIQKQS